jgi:TonB family protein
VRRLDQRQGFLVSAAIHLTLLMILIAHPPSPNPSSERIDPSTLERKDLVFLPPREVLRRLVPAPKRMAPPVPLPNVVPAPQAVPLPVPPAETKKDRVSVGSPGRQTKGPLLLRREDDLTRMAARGEPAASPTPTPAARPAPATLGSPPGLKDRAEGRQERPGREGLDVQPGLHGTTRAGDEGQRARTGRDTPAEVPGDPSATALDRAALAAIEEVAQRMRRDAQLGIRTGTGQNMGGLNFDPQGADFTLWINQFKNEVYRNWIVPQTVLLGFRGHVDFEFTVERDGSISELRMLKSSGTVSLDRAAQNALTSSRLAALPDDYGPPRVTMQVTFFYNEGPRGS